MRKKSNKAIQFCSPKFFVTNVATEKTKQKFSCTDEAIKLVKFCAIKRHFCLYKHIFLAMKRYDRFRNLFFEAMQQYNIRRYKSFTDEATRSPSILENVSITAILYLDKRKNICESYNCGQKYSSTENLLIFPKYLGIICITFKGTVHKHANV